MKGTLLFLSLLLLLLDKGSSSSDFSFNFSSFSFKNLSFLGDSYLRNGVIGLTRESGVPSSSSGSVICTSPIPFHDPYTNISASFSTRFTFSITNLNPSSIGDGLTFFLSPNNQILGSPGAYLGLPDPSSSIQFLAVEFDTRMDAQFGDPNDNHVGLDIASMVSLSTADVLSAGVRLKSGKSITAWIDYDNVLKIFKVWIAYTSSGSTKRPRVPVLRQQGIDLSKYYQEIMYVGFSASTEGSTELHLIQDWSFRTSGFSYSKSNVSNHTIVPVIPIVDTTRKTRKKKHEQGLGFGIAAAAAAVLFCLFALLGYYTWISFHNRNKAKTRMEEIVKGPRQFQYWQLKTATKGFHSSQILGHGSFGTVYKAVFQANAPGTTTYAAVKRSKHHQGKTDFMSELSIIACLRHKNLVQLQGWCCDKGELLLVYEFMPNGTLDDLLYQQVQGDDALSWSHRYNIALGIASVLTYLHRECQQQIIHRDIKTSNIMLDANYNPRLGDFGLARLMEHDKSPVSTLTAGTMGYLAPEYLQYGKATEKTDVFSFGVVLLELACGRRPINDAVNLVDWVWTHHSQGRLIEAADKRLKGEFFVDQMLKLLLLGLSCANPSSSDRPSIRRVLQILNNEAGLVRLPKTKPTISFSSGIPPLSTDDDCSSQSEAVVDTRITID